MESRLQAVFALFGVPPSGGLRSPPAPRAPSHPSAPRGQWLRRGNQGKAGVPRTQDHRSQHRPEQRRYVQRTGAAPRGTGPQGAASHKTCDSLWSAAARRRFHSRRGRLPDSGPHLEPARRRRRSQCGRAVPATESDHLLRKAAWRSDGRPCPLGALIRESSKCLVCREMWARDGGARGGFHNFLQDRPCQIGGLLLCKV